MGLGRASTTAEILAPSEAIIVWQVAISPRFVVYSRTLDCGTKIQALAQLWGQCHGQGEPSSSGRSTAWSLGYSANVPALSEGDDRLHELGHLS